MAEQWLRKCKLTVQINKNEPIALDLSDFHITFQVAQPTTDQPKYAEIYIYNLSAKTMNLLAGDDNQIKDTQVLLEVGYQSTALNLLFKGNVFQYRRGRDNQTDTWLCILAQSSDKYKQNAVINQSVPAGVSINDMNQLLMGEVQKYNVEQGYTPTLSNQQYARGRVFFGSLDRHVQQFCADNNLNFHVSDDVLNMYKIGHYIEKPAISITRHTGMIGMPELTTEGLNVSCLLNPELQRGGRIVVDLGNLQTEAYDIQYGKQGIDQPQKNANTATNKQGYFIVQSVQHFGDNRGDTWYTQTVSTAPGAVQPMTGISIKGVS